MEKGEILSILGTLNAAYPTNKLDDAGAVVYGKFLEDLDYSACRSAMLQWVKTQRFFPSIAELVEMTRIEMKRVEMKQAQLPPPPPEDRREEARRVIAEIRERQGWTKDVVKRLPEETPQVPPRRRRRTAQATNPETPPSSEAEPQQS